MRSSNLASLLSGIPDMNRPRTRLVIEGAYPPENYNTLTINSHGVHPQLIAKPVDGLGPLLVYDRIKKDWINFWNARVKGVFTFTDMLELHESPILE